LPGGYKPVEHTADLGIKAWGQNQRELLEEAALGMVSQVYNPDTVGETEVRTLDLEAEAMDELLLRWLREILYFMENESLLFKRFQIETDNFSNKDEKTLQIRASLHGEKRDPTRHDICKEIKAVTRHGLYAKKVGPWWEANVLFDV
jgi:SHS2 domain-containing protein